MRAMALLLLLGAPASAARVKGEEALRRFVTGDAALKARLDDAAAREQAFLAENRETELRDSVGQPESRAKLLERLPGLRRAAGGCVALSDCATPELALDVADPSELQDSVRRLVRPWLLLQQARGRRLDMKAVASGDAVLSLELQGLKEPALTLNVAPRLLGGFKLWFDRPLVLAALYDRERTAALQQP